ncbi:hypothetical protein ACFQ07_02300 [Actinomadura adrarensis]|uniref:Uncharacterized protein n=1 Tax=Actinomadura adrarensis TaxID=1819600 RepID=A0ABW3C997_9ACTN
MVDGPLAVEESRQALAVAYPEWRIWLSARGELWNATRLRDVRGRDGQFLDRTLVCDSSKELATELARQRELEQTAASS